MVRVEHSVDEDQLSERYDELIERAEKQDLDWESALEDAPDEMAVKVSLLAALTGTDPEGALFADELPEEA